MKLRNKKTEEIIERYIIETARAIGANLILQDNDTNKHYQYNSLAELNEEWEDVPEEPKDFWYIGHDGAIFKLSEWENQKDHEEIGNYFESEEEAKRALEKLKALANLRKRGLKFNGWDSADRGLVGEFEIYCDAVNLDSIEQELELVFGREEM